MMLKFLSIFLYVLVGFQTIGSESVKTNHTKLSLLTSTSIIKAQEPFWIAVRFKMDEEWNIYAPHSENLGLPPTLEWSLPQGVKILETLWPAPKIVKIDSITNYIYEEEVWILVKMQSDITLEFSSIKLNSEWLICNDTCLPSKAALEINFPYTKQLISPERLQYWLNQIQEINSLSNSSNLWISALFLAFLGGLILNCMPCVLPILSLKILKLVSYKDESGNILKKHGLIFTAGVMSSFWAIATVLLIFKAGGNQLGWGFQLQSPVFVSMLAALFLIMALNLWGVFEIGTSLGRINIFNSSTGYVASFISGVLACVVASPCTAPFMGTALSIAFMQPWWEAIVIFTGLGFGVAFPFLLICFFPQLIQWLPKPGVWMESFKQFLGFCLGATVLWLLWIISYQQGIDKTFIVAAGLLLLSIGWWIIGRWAAPYRENRTRLIGCLVGVSIIICSLILILNQTINREKINIEAIWEPYTAERFNSLRAEGKSVFIDFTANWCITCQVNKKTVLESFEVVREFKEKNIILLRADWTAHNSMITKALSDYGQNSIPFYALHTGKEENPPYIFPQILTSKVILKALDKLK